MIKTHPNCFDSIEDLGCREQCSEQIEAGACVLQILGRDSTDTSVQEVELLHVVSNGSSKQEFSGVFACPNNPKCGRFYFKGSNTMTNTFYTS